jgi:hypothetical protein
VTGQQAEHHLHISPYTSFSLRDLSPESVSRPCRRHTRHAETLLFKSAPPQTGSGDLKRSVLRTKDRDK